MEAINEFLIKLLDKDPLILILFIVIMFLILVIYATRAVSKQNTEDHTEKKQLIELIQNTSAAFVSLKDAIDSLRVAQDIRNETNLKQLEAMNKVGIGVELLNKAFADYHVSIDDTLQLNRDTIVAKMNYFEGLVTELSNAIKNTPDNYNRIERLLERIVQQNEEIKVLIAQKPLIRSEN